MPALDGSGTVAAEVPLAQSGRPLFMPQRFQLGQRAEMPQGVDLNLDKFSLSTEERFVGRLPPCSGGPESMEGRSQLGKSFLAKLASTDLARHERGEPEAACGHLQRTPVRSHTGRRQLHSTRSKHGICHQGSHVGF